MHQIVVAADLDELDAALGWVAGGGLADPGRPDGDDDAELDSQNTIADRLATPG